MYTFSVDGTPSIPAAGQGALLPGAHHDTKPTLVVNLWENVCGRGVAHGDVVEHLNPSRYGPDSCISSAGCFIDADLSLVGQTWTHAAGMPTLLTPACSPGSGENATLVTLPSCPSSF